MNKLSIEDLENRQVWSQSRKFGQNCPRDFFRKEEIKQIFILILFVNILIKTIG